MAQYNISTGSTGAGFAFCEIQQVIGGNFRMTLPLPCSVKLDEREARLRIASEGGGEIDLPVSEVLVAGGGILDAPTVKFNALVAVLIAPLSTGGGGGGGPVTIAGPLPLPTNLINPLPLPISIASPLPVPVIDDADPVIVLVDEPAGDFTYIGTAPRGTSTAAASWLIRRVERSGTATNVLLASVNADQIWANRTSLTYA